MTTRTMRRLVAAVAASTLLVVAAPAITPASAASSCAPGATCEGTLTGKLGPTTYKIQMPQKFNGTVLVWSHGYRIGTPVPAALAVPLGLANSTSYDKISFPAFQASLGSDVAYIGTKRAEIAPADNVAEALLGQGYALAGTGYAAQGWATPEGVEANELMIKAIDKGAIKGVKKVYAWGASLGGLIAATVAERNPTLVDGVLPTCGVLAGPEQAFNTAMTVLYSWKTLIAPSLKVANYSGYSEALGDLGTVLQTLLAVSQNSSLVSSVGYPVAQANLLAGLMGGLPSKSSTYDGITTNPAVGTLGIGAASAGGYSPLSAGANSAAAMLENVGGAAALGILGRYELEQRIRLTAGIPAGESANFNDNVNVSYSRLLSPEQRGEFGDTLNATTVLPNALNAMLAKLDSTKGDKAARFAANPKAVKAVQALPAATGTYTVPTVLMSTTYDNIVPAGNTQYYYDRLMASIKKDPPKGLAKVAQFYTVPPESWTVIDPGAKGVNGAASRANATSGVGHCNFALDGGVQLVNAVTALNKLVNAKTPKQVKAVNRYMWGTPGVNGDGFFQPDPLKRPNLQPKG